MACYLTKRLIRMSNINKWLSRSFQVNIVLTRDFSDDIQLSRNNDGPINILKEKIKNGELVEDEYQMKIAQSLQNVYDNIHGYEPEKPGIFSKLIGKGKKKKKVPKGLYLFGAVGGGKTMLMDLFYTCCKVINKIIITLFNSPGIYYFFNHFRLRVNKEFIFIHSCWMFTAKFMKLKKQ